jgi:cell division protein FtsZ
MLFDLPKEQSSIIKVIGVGGGGSNAVNHMYRQGIKGVDFVICNTDQQALDISPVPLKIALGASLTEGRGAGSIPEVGRNAAIENIEEVRNILTQNTKMVFITAGMGGGTGTGAAPIIANVAREMGILTVGIITIPFLFEGKKRRLQAEEGINAMKNNVDTLLVICNDKLRQIYGNLSLKSAFGKADDILTTAAKGIAEIITVTGYINVDFEDVKTVMTNSGVAIMGSARAEGENRAIDAVRMALESPLLNDNHIKGAKYILLNIASGKTEVTMDEITEITDYIQDEAGMTADIIWGNCEDESLDEGLSVTIISTGFKTSQEIVSELSPNEKKIVKHELKPDPAPVAEIKHDPVVQEITEPERAETRVSEVDMEPKLIVREEEKVEMEKEDEKKPELKKKDEILFETEDEQNVIEFDFTATRVEVVEQKTNIPQAPEHKSVPVEQPVQKPVYRPVEPTVEPAQDDMNRRINEKIARLRAMSMKLNSPNGIIDLEREPAYKRRNVKLDSVAHSSDSQVSRYSLTEDEEKKHEIKPNNPYIHDKPD